MVKRVQLKKMLLVSIIFLGFGVLLTGCKANNQTSSKKIKTIQVVASVDFYGQVAQAVLGNKGQVVSVITKPSVDPHDYQPTTAVAKAVSQANVILYNGIGYDSWMGKLAVNNAQAKKIRVGEDLLHKHTGDNPHVWYRPTTMATVATALAHYFGKLQPQNRQYFEKRAQRYLATLKPLNALIAKVKQQSQHQLVDVSEPVFDYALQHLGYRENNSAFAKTVENGTDPSPAMIKNLQTDLKERRIAFFVQNTQATDKVVLNLVKLAHEHQVPVLKVTETLPQGKQYVSWMMAQYQQLAKIQQQTHK